jgi:hypothetical protein
VQRADTPSDFVVRDEFDQTSGPLTTKSLPGGVAVWAGAGDSTDFDVDASPGFHVAVRTAVSDAADTGRFALAYGSTFTDIVAAIDFQAAGSFVDHHAVTARWVDVDNWLMASYSVVGPDAAFQIRKCVGGTIEPLAIVPMSLLAFKWYSLRVMVLADGSISGWIAPTGSEFGAPIQTGAVEAATGGALDEGLVGFYDEHTGADATTRYYDNMAAWVPPQRDAAMYANQSLELTHDRAVRQSPDGTVPVTGSDPANDEIVAELFATSRGLVV